MTFKGIIKEIGKVENLADQGVVFDLIKKSFEDGKITFDDYELLYDIADFYGYGKYIHNLNKYHEGI